VLERGAAGNHLGVLAGGYHPSGLEASRASLFDVDSMSSVIMLRSITYHNVMDSEAAVKWTF